MIQFLEIFSLVMGIIYMVMQVFQGKYMWYFDLLTAGSAMIVAFSSHIWGNALLQAYFLVMATIGLIRWRRMESHTEKGEMHLLHMERSSYIKSAAIFFGCGAIICFILYKTNDPKPLVDGISLALSIVACWWLTRSYLSQWLLWIVADCLMFWLYFSQCHYGLAALYFCYVITSVIGYFYWKKHGKYIPREEVL